MRLGVNEKYRNDLLFAEKVTGTNASSLAGLVNAEAAKKGGVWQPDSYNSTTKAGGLTQFLPGTWREMAETPGTYLNEVAVQKGYVQKGANGRFHVVAEAEVQKLCVDIAAAAQDKFAVKIKAAFPQI